MRWMIAGLLVLALSLPALTDAAQLLTLQSAAVATGNGTPLPVANRGVAGLSVTGTFVGTVTFEGSVDGSVSWSSFKNCTTIDTGVTGATTTTTGQFLCAVTGLTDLRARISDYTSGSITVTGFPVVGGGGSGGGSGVGGSTPTLAGCWATVSQPTYLEGTLNAISCTLAGLVRVSVDAITVLLSCEDTTNKLCTVSGGPVRLTTFSSVTSATTSSVTTVPIGVKTFMGYMGGASETKAFTVSIYGNWQNSTTGGQLVCQIWVPSTASVTHIETTCKDVVKNYTYWFYTADVYTSASSAPFTLYAKH